MTENRAPPRQLEAAGSLARAAHHQKPSRPRRVWLWLELVILFICTPILMVYLVHGYRIPLVLVLQPVLLGMIIYLLIDRGFKLTRELRPWFPLRALAHILGIFGCVAAAVALYVSNEMPETFLSMPRYRPDIWIMIVTFYPLLSVIPQELVYRTFFFHRYGPLFGTHRWAAILLNGALFGFAHIVLGNWLAIVATFALGCLLAFTYERTRSFWAVWFEHALYGWLVFTIGIGRYFYTGVSNFSN